MKIKITNDCVCESDNHEVATYPREGLTVQSFKAGAELELVKRWDNMCGTFYKVKTQKGFADIKESNATTVG